MTKTELPYTADASAYYAAIADLPWSAWLDSGGRGDYDILTAAPAITLLTQDQLTTVSHSSGSLRSSDDPLDLLRQQLGKPQPAHPGVPFSGGALGFWSYDLARRSFKLTDHHPASATPEMAVGIYDWALVIDHRQRSAHLVSTHRFPQTAALLPDLLIRWQSRPTPVPAPFSVHGPIRRHCSRERYQVAFDTVQAYLRAGDCYQVNLAQRFSAEASGDAWAAYLTLRELSPAPYSAFLNFPSGQVLSASPECFLQLKSGAAATRPIKGTRRRGNDAAQDAALTESLRTHPKDRAENLMIVDLLRNDLGRCCQAGSVRVPALFAVESYAQVHHLVSTVTGQLADGEDALSLLRACFPGGSITGAPKQRAMEIIDELESQRRGLYCGAIGYIGFDGNMDSNIAIRTLFYANGEISTWAGGGLVADSEAESEYQETLDKAAGMLALLRRHGAV